MFRVRPDIRDMEIDGEKARETLARLAELNCDLNNLNLAGSFGEWRLTKIQLIDALNELLEVV